MPLLSAPPIAPWNLLWLLLPLLVVYVVLVRTRVGNHRRLLGGVLRGAVQLSLVGYLLAPLFEVDDAPLVALVRALICALAAFFSLGVLGKGPGLGIWPLAVVAILPVVIGLTLFGLGLVVSDVNLFEARYAITLAGMLAGNAMNATALAGERFLDGLRSRRAEVEMRLLLGASGRHATSPLVADGIRAAITPSINGLYAVGLVSFPGMMTGQMMAGEDPLPAAFYQMMIMALWTAAACLAPRLFLHLLQGRLLKDHRVQEDAPVHGTAFDVSASPLAVTQPLVFDERPPESLTRGFIDQPRE
jgi:putative ABC transport system permease protein